jgi:hypothetical protein
MASEMTPAADDPRAADWGDLSWSDWHDFDEAHHYACLIAPLVVLEGLRLSISVLRPFCPELQAAAGC